MALVARARSAPLVTRRRLAGVGSTPLSWARVIDWPVSFQSTSMRPDRPLAMPLMVKAALGPVILIQTLVPGTAILLPLARVVSEYIWKERSPLMLFVPAWRALVVVIACWMVLDEVPLRMLRLVKVALRTPRVTLVRVPARTLKLVTVALATPRVALVRTAVEAMRVPRTWTVSAMVP